VHEHWGDNVFLETRVDIGNADGDRVRRTAAIRVERTLRTARQSMSPMEGRGVVAQWDRRLEQLIQEAVVTVSRALIAETVNVIAVLSGRGADRRLSELAHVAGLGTSGDYSLSALGDQ